MFFGTKIKCCSSHLDGQIRKFQSLKLIPCHYLSAQKNVWSETTIIPINRCPFPCPWTPQPPSFYMLTSKYKIYYTYRVFHNVGPKIMAYYSQNMSLRDFLSLASSQGINNGSIKVDSV